MKKSVVVTYTGLFIALNVLLTHFLSFQPTPFLRLSFGFLPVALCAAFFGPVAGGIAAGLGDVLGYLLFPAGGYLPGLTLSAVLTGIVFGLLLRGRAPSVLRCLAAAAVTLLLFDAGLNTVFLHFIIPGETLYALFIARLIKSLFMLPVEVFLIYAVSRLFTRLRIPRRA